MRNFVDVYDSSKFILMEGALGERLKREYKLSFDSNVVMAGLVYSKDGREALSELWREYANVARCYQLPFMATTPTRRVNQCRVNKSDFSFNIIKDNVDFLDCVRNSMDYPFYIGGMLGCAGDAYTGLGCLNRDDSEKFHTWEIELFSETNVDYLYAALIPSLEEAIGIAKVAQKFSKPYIISFTINQDGHIISGELLSEAIRLVDVEVNKKPLCYMANCVHPDIIYSALDNQPTNMRKYLKRFLGVQVNTSKMPFDQLDNSKKLFTSEPYELSKSIMKLHNLHNMKIFGGCCGTDGAHMEAIAKELANIND